MINACVNKLVGVDLVNDKWWFQMRADLFNNHQFLILVHFRFTNSSFWFFVFASLHKSPEVQCGHNCTQWGTRGDIEVGIIAWSWAWAGAWAWALSHSCSAEQHALTWTHQYRVAFPFVTRNSQKVPMMQCLFSKKPGCRCCIGIAGSNRTGSTASWVRIDEGNGCQVHWRTEQTTCAATAARAFSAHLQEHWGPQEACQEERHARRLGNMISQFAIIANKLKYDLVAD